MASCTESSEEESEVRLLPPKKKPKSDTDFRKCIICQEKSSERLRSPTEAGLRSFKEAAEVRKDETYHRILSTSENLDALDVVWHGKCFQSYTSKRNLSFIKPLPFAESKERHGDRPSSRSQVNAVDWSLCLFCQQKKSKGTTKLMNVSTFDSCEAIEEAARRRSDESMLLKISGVDLIAVEAKYHKHCRSQYVSKSNLMFVDFRVDGEEDVYTQAFQNLREDIKPQLESGVALDMKTLLDSYQGILQHLGCNTAKSYKSERLKRRLQQSFQEEIVFQKLPDPSKPELVYSSSISLQDVINSAAKKSCQLAKMSASSEDESSNSQGQNDVNSILYHAAQILRSSIRSESKSIGIQPVDVEDISACKVKSLMPKDLYKFLCLMISNPDKVDVSAPTASNAADERHILAIAQDLIYATTHGRVKTPKHIGLAMSVRHMTGSKHLVTMLNRFGHCCSYDDIEVVDTSLALDIIASSENLGAVVPSNISPGVFVQVAGDNNDINEETLDGKQTTHATTLVLYQRKQQGPKPKPAVRPAHSEKRRSLNISDANPPLLEFGACGKRPAVTFYKDKIEEEWFQSSSSLCTTAIQMDFGWFLTRLCTHQLFSENLQNREDEVFQPLPSWSGFNAKIASEPPPLTSVGYCPMINGSPTEYSTVYTAMKNVQAMMDVLHQKHSVITFDLAIYMKAKEIQWRRPEEFKNTVIRMGGFHIALNFLSVIGKIFQDSGIEDLLIESGVYGCHTASMLLKGKSYNRGVRAHKLVLEALLRLQWQAFGAWMEAEDVEVPTVYQRQCLSLINCCQRESNDVASLKTSFGLLCDKLPQLQQIFTRFCTEASQQSKLFHFWNMYIDIVLLLLRFIRAEREGSWKLHLKAVAEMVPYFFSMDRINYSRWLPIYLADMQLLSTHAPEVYEEFLNGNHPVSRSSQPFSQVWTDMALEQTINLDSKTRGGIVGLTQNASALDRWFITSHKRAELTAATKRLCNLEDSDKIGTHKEAGSQRVKRDENDVQRLINTITNTMSNPFDLSEASKEDPVQLRNIATGLVMPHDAAERLVDCFSTGAEEAKKFRRQRMDSDEVSFWSKISKLNLKTFASLAKTNQIKCADEKIITISADRNLFGRLLIAAKCRDVDVKEVLSYELSTVPFALAHADGALRKTTKSVLMAEVERECQAQGRLPESALSTAFIFDAMALVQTLKSAGSRTFGDLAERHFNVLSTPLRQGQCRRVDVVFDRYDVQESIKESERVRRGSSRALEIQITNKHTPVPKQWGKFISNQNNKVNLSRFLCREWCSLGEYNLLPDQELVIGGGFEDPTDAVVVTRGRTDPLAELRSDHEEADTRMILHAWHASSTKERIVIQSPDTDVAVLAIYAYQMIQCNEIWFKTGVKDKVRFVPVHRIAEKLGRSVCAAIPAFHALTGCDSTSGLFQTGKKKGWKVFVKYPSLHDSVGHLGSQIPPPAITVEACERFICSLYTTNEKAGVTADDVRYWMFCQKYQRSESLPPTSNSLRHHIERANYQAYVWKQCLNATQQLPSPVSNGWKKVDGVLEPLLMSKDPAPQGLLELTTCKCTKSVCRRDDLCPCKAHEMPCTEACLCMNDESCQNPHKPVDVTPGSSEDELTDADA